MDGLRCAVCVDQRRAGLRARSWVCEALALTVQLWIAVQLGSQSEPDLNAARRRRKRGSKKVKKVKNGALGPREEIHRSNCTYAVTCGVHASFRSSS